MSKMTASVQMEEKLWKQFQAECKKRGSNHTELITFLVTEFLENPDKYFNMYLKRKLDEK